MDSKREFGPNLLPRSVEEEPGNNPPLLYLVGEPRSQDGFNLTATRVLQGGMARVYLCPLEPKQAVLFGGRSVVAIKRVRPSFASYESLLSMQREAHFWLMLEDHPNIVRLLLLSWGQGTPTLVLEYVERSLRDRLEEEVTFSVHETVQIALDVLQGLLFAQNQLDGFIHGDLKPENILIDSNGVAKVSDFGLASAVRDANFGPAGTPVYLAPEAQKMPRSELTEAVDVYAVGCILFEMLSGAPLIDPESRLEECLAWHRVGRPPMQALEGIRLDLVHLVERSLDKYAPSRPSVRDLMTAFVSLAGELGVPLPADTSRPRREGFDFARRLTAAGGLMSLGYSRQAMAIYQQVVQDPAASRDEAIEAMHQLAQRLLLQGALQEAYDLIQRSEKLRPFKDDSTEARQMMLTGMYLRQSGSEADAYLSLMRGAAKLCPVDPDMWMILALAYGHLGQFREAAEAAYHVAYVCNSVRLEHAERLVIFALMAEMPDEALAWAYDIVSVHPESGWAHALRAVAIASRGLTHNEITVFLQDVDIANLDPLTPAHLLASITSYRARLVAELERLGDDVH